MISYDSMVTEVTARLGGRTDISNRVGRWIVYAFYEILMNPRFSFFELDHDFQTTINIGDLSLDLSAISNFWFMLSIRDITNHRRLERSHIRIFDDITPTTGQIQRYARFGKQLFYDPIPDAAVLLGVRYRNRPTEPSSGSTFEGLGTEWEEPLVVLSVVKGWEALENWEKAATQRQLLEPMLQSRQDVPQLEDGVDSEVTIEPITEYRGG